MNALVPPPAPQATLCLDGDLTIARAAELKARLLEVLRGSLDVDLSGVTAIDGAGLQLLVMLDREAALRGMSVTWHAPSRAVRAAFERLRIQGPGELSAPASRASAIA